ncbi:hypothetical protein QOM21_08155 [Streptomyces sp. Pv4-95]|uniref:hypothetical protein n=1 Tax=Streptomyces sp. Pv4-95 TaxID=3049543 RepID=UPI003891D81B
MDEVRAFFGTVLEPGQDVLFASGELRRAEVRSVAAATPVADRQEWPQPFPLGIRQITPPHTRNNVPSQRQVT